MRRFVSLGLLAGALGCSFDASGISESSSAGPGGPGTSSGTTSVGSGDAEPSTGELVTTGGGEGTVVVSSSGAVDPVTTGGPEGTDTGVPMTTDVSTTTGTVDPETGSETTGPPNTTEPPDDTTTTGMPACPMPYMKMMPATEAKLVEPMTLGMSDAENAMVAFSPTAEMGIATFAIDLPCDSQVAVWARVQDLWDGIHQGNDPDSLYPHVDNMQEQGWLYGCQTEGKSDGYHWLRVRMGVPGDDCDTFVDLTPQLSAGPHTISFRNREAKYNSAAAAISRVLVTTDLGFVPQ